MEVIKLKLKLLILRTFYFPLVPNIKESDPPTVALRTRSIIVMIRRSPHIWSVIFLSSPRPVSVILIDNGGTKRC